LRRECITGFSTVQESRNKPRNHLVNANTREWWCTPHIALAFRTPSWKLNLRHGIQIWKTIPTSLIWTGHQNQSSDYGTQPSSDNVSYLFAALLTDGLNYILPVCCALPRLSLAEDRERGLVLKNSNIHGKSTSMLGDYDTNEHVRGLNYKAAIQPTGRRYHNQEKGF